MYLLQDLLKTGNISRISTITIVVDNMYIFDNIRIRGGTVIISDIDKEGLYVGNPARFIR